MHDFSKMVGQDRLVAARSSVNAEINEAVTDIINKMSKLLDKFSGFKLIYTKIYNTTCVRINIIDPFSDKILNFIHFDITKIKEKHIRMFDINTLIYIKQNNYLINNTNDNNNFINYSELINKIEKKARKKEKKYENAIIKYQSKFQNVKNNKGFKFNNKNGFNNKKGFNNKYR